MFYYCIYRWFILFVTGVAFVVSVLAMTAISLERFFGIVTPFMFCSYKREKMSVLVALIWIIAIAAAVPSAGKRCISDAKCILLVC